MPRPEIQIFVALIAAIASLIVALIGFLSSRRNQRDLAELQSKSQRDLQELQSQLAEQKSARDALRDYEYEARKRLYHQCGPLLFLLLEQSESALKRIIGLAKSAAGGHLNASDSWLDDRYYHLSTWHRLVAPLGTFKLLQRSLTLVDFSLDRQVYLQYRLAKQLYNSFADDFRIAELSIPPLPYDPHDADAESKRVAYPETYWQQGIPIGILDNAVEALLIKESANVWRVMTFAEFQSEFEHEGGSGLRTAFNHCDYLFKKFHPRSRQVLWRMLVIQAYLYNALLKIGEGDQLKSDIKSVMTLPEQLRRKLDWRAKAEDEDDSIVLFQPFDTAEKYLSERLAPLFESAIQITP
jgi:hypothetical protein